MIHDKNINKDTFPSTSFEIAHTNHVETNEGLSFQEFRIKDKYYINYYVCMIVGIASLMPYQCTIISSDYFIMYHGKSIVVKIVTIQNIFHFIVIISLMKFNQLFPIRARIIFLLITTIIIFSLIPYLSYIYEFVLFIAAITGTLCGCLAASIIGYSQIFSSKKYVSNFCCFINNNNA